MISTKASECFLRLLVFLGLCWLFFWEVKGFAEQRGQNLPAGRQGMYTRFLNPLHTKLYLLSCCKAYTQVQSWCDLESRYDLPSYQRTYTQKKRLCYLVVGLYVLGFGALITISLFYLVGALWKRAPAEIKIFLILVISLNIVYLNSTSTLRFFALPSSVVFVSNGYEEPYPL